MENTNKTLNWIGVVVSIIVGIVAAVQAYDSILGDQVRSFGKYFGTVAIGVIAAAGVFLLFFIIKLIVRFIIKASTKRKETE